MQPWIIAIIVVAAVVAVLFILAAITYKVAFGVRYDKIKIIKYFPHTDFNLNTAPVSLDRGLKGAIYDSGDYEEDKFAVFVHGMGPGHAPYMTEIAYLCNLGLRVLAVDSRGCGTSAGKNIGGMYGGVKTAVAAIDFVRKKFPECKILVLGHSWGGYSALCASAKRKVDKVVAISAPNTPARTLYEGAAKIISKPVAAVFYPFWWIINFLKYGKNGNLNAAKCANKNGTPTLLVHGDKDTVVTPTKAVFYRNTGENVKKYLSKGKGHNPYNTIEAEKKLGELQTAFTNSRKMTAEEKKNYFESFDYKAATEEDEEVMREIALFLKG